LVVVTFSHVLQASAKWVFCASQEIGWEDRLYNVLKP